MNTQSEATDSATILALLNRLDDSPEGLPVIAKTSRGIVFLGRSHTHEGASMLGALERISCEATSRGVIQNDPKQRKFFLLRGSAS